MARPPKYVAKLFIDDYQKLTAERDTLKALCVELVAELERWCREDCDTASGNLLTRARSIVK